MWVEMGKACFGGLEERDRSVREHGVHKVGAAASEAGPLEINLESIDQPDRSRLVLT